MSDDALDLEQFLELVGTRVEERAREDRLVGLTHEGAGWRHKGAQVRIERMPQANAAGDLMIVRHTASGAGAGGPIPTWCKRSSVELVATGIINFFYWLANP